jgi:hypothetical protein
MSRRALSLACALVAGACGAAPATPVPAERSHTGRAPPPSDADPLPYTPGPGPAGETDRAVALAVSGGEDQARRMLPALLLALRDGDEQRLAQLLADDLSYVHGDPTATRSRSGLVQSVSNQARRAALQPDLTVEQLVDLESVRVTRAAQYWQDRPMPTGLVATDLVVEVSVSEEGRVALRNMLGQAWNAHGALVVRPGSDPRILAL